jgi:CheY-like chemotaxis protein
MARGKVLVVSYDAARRRAIRDNLFVAGHSVLDAPNRGAALEACEDFRPAVVVVDLYGSARRAAERQAAGKPSKTSVNHVLVRQIASRFPDVKIIALCGSDFGPTANEAVAAGARDYVKEPLCIGELLVRVDRFLGLPTKVERLHRRIAEASALRSTTPSPIRWNIPAQPSLEAVDGASSHSPTSARVAAPIGSLRHKEPDRRLSPASPPEDASPETPSPADSPADAGAGIAASDDRTSAHMEFGDASHRDSPPDRLGELVGEEHVTLAWIGLHGLDRLVASGLLTYRTASEALHPVISTYIPDGEQYWAGSEAVVVVAKPIATPVELAVELKDAIAAELTKLGVFEHLSLRASVATRRWGEGRALFLARATGRISNGALPVSPHLPGSEPHPSVVFTSNALALRTSQRLPAPTTGADQRR